MLELQLRIEFHDIFPTEECLDVLSYLKGIHYEFLLRVIGVLNSGHKLDYKNFFGDPKLNASILQRISEAPNLKGVTDPLKMLNDVSTMILTEIILANEEEVRTCETLKGKGEYELSIFKAYLAINSNLNRDKGAILEENEINQSNYEIAIDLAMASSMLSSDFSPSKNDFPSFFKLIYSTLIKIKLLSDFLKENKFENIRISLAKAHNFDDWSVFVLEVQRLLAGLMKMKLDRKYIYSTEHKGQLKLLTSMLANKIEVTKDFTEIKKRPIIHLKNDEYIMINYFYIVDKFYRGLVFTLKEIFYKQTKLNFTSYFPVEFSEKYLGKRMLEKIFHKKWQIREAGGTYDGAPDFYVRERNKIFIFEIKDTGVSAEVKTSMNVGEIKNDICKKFVRNIKNRPKAVCQLINNIESLIRGNIECEKDFIFKPNMKIFPVLILCDRSWEVPGFNYYLNKELEKNKSSIISDERVRESVQSLTVIDMDTLIFNSDSYAKNNMLILEDFIKHVRHFKNNVKKGGRNQRIVVENMALPYSFKFLHKPDVAINNLAIFEDLIFDLKNSFGS